MTPAELAKKLENEDKTFVWLRRQMDEQVVKEILALNIKGIYTIKEYKRLYPEGESAAHIVGFTNVEDKGQEGVELIFQNQLSGKAGARRVIKDRLGRVVEDVGQMTPPVDGEDLQLSIDSKVQFLRIKNCVKRCFKTKPRRVVWWCWMPSQVKFWRWPTTQVIRQTSA